MISMAQALQTALLHFVWQGVAVALLLWIALLLLRKRTPQARYIVSCAALATMLALPAGTAYLAYHPATPSRTAAATIPGALSASDATPAALASATTHWLTKLEPWALPLWAAGVLFFSLRLVWCCWRVSAMRRRGVPAEVEIQGLVADLGKRLGLTRVVRVLTTPASDGPSIVGWLRPVLLLPPATLLGLTPEQLDAILAHELAHVRRYDHVVNAIQSLIETLLFYHPAVWWTSARIREERELCCDDLAVRACGDALCFARALTKLERLRIVTPAAALGSTGGSLRNRVQRLVGVAPNDYAPSKWSAVAALALALGCLAASVQWLHAQEPIRPTAGVYSFIIPDRDSDDPGVTVDLGGVAVMHRDRVEYPETVRKSGVQGTVAVQVALDASGNVADAHVVSGPIELRKTVMTSIFTWHFAQSAAGSTRMVNVAFQKSAADAPRMVEGVPGVLAATEAGEHQAGVEGVVGAVRLGDAVPDSESGHFVNRAISRDGRYYFASRSESSDSFKAGLADARREVERAQEELLLAQKTRSADASAAAESHVRDARKQLAAVEESDRHAVEGEPKTITIDAPSEREPIHTTGRTLIRIDAPMLAENVRNDLMSRLPIKVGDTLQDTTLEAVAKAIRGFDEHLTWHVELTRNNGVTIQIEAPRGAIINK